MTCLHNFFFWGGGLGGLFEGRDLNMRERERERERGFGWKTAEMACCLAGHDV